MQQAEEVLGLVLGGKAVSQTITQEKKEKATCPGQRAGRAVLKRDFREIPLESETGKK